MKAKLIRLVIFIAGFALLVCGARLIYFRYHHPTIPGESPISKESELSPDDESVLNPYLRGRQLLPRRYPSAEDSPSSIPTPSPVLKLSITTAQLPMGAVGEEYHQVLQSRGGMGLLVWKLEGELPPGLDLEKGGIIEGRPEEEGEWRFTIAVEDEREQSARKKYRLIIRKGLAAESKEELSILTVLLPEGVLGRDYLGEIEVAGGQTPYAWSLVGGRLPELVLLNKERGFLYGIPRETGIFSFTIGVTDASGDWTEMNYSLIIRDGQLEIITDALPNAVQGQEYYLQFQARGGVVPYRWEMVSGRLPWGIKFDAERGILHGLPERMGTGHFSIRVKDNRGRAAEKEFSLKVVGAKYEAGVYSWFRITTPYLPPATRGQLYFQQLEAEGGAPPYVWTVSQGKLPPRLFLDSGLGQISGIPEQEGKYVFTVLVSDQNQATAEAQYSLTVSLQLVYITTGTLSPAVIGQPYQQQIDVTGGTPPYLWSIDSGSLPPGLSLDSETGQIHGLVADYYGETAEYIFRVKASDQAWNYDIAELRLIVRKTAEPTPLTTPTPVEGEARIINLIAAGSDGKVGVSWSNPTTAFKRIEVLRKTGSYPQTPSDGQAVYSGTGNNFVDQGLNNGTIYFYAAIAYDQDDYPSPLHENCLISARPAPVGLFSGNDPFADEVILFSPLSPGGFGSSQLPDIVLGPPMGQGSWQGSLDVVSLHARVYDGTSPCGGSIILKFSDNIVVNGSGDDFTVFENVFYLIDEPEKRWMEPAVVAVSQDGVNFYQFPINYVYHYNDDGSINFYNPYSYSRGFTGINPVISNNGDPDPTNPVISGGDSFDLSDITSKNLSWIQYIKITSTGDNWLTDVDGDKVRHTQDMGSCSGAGSSGFDLDAVCAINY